MLKTSDDYYWWLLSYLIADLAGDLDIQCMILYISIYDFIDKTDSLIRYISYCFKFIPKLPTWAMTCIKKGVRVGISNFATKIINNYYILKSYIIRYLVSGSYFK